MTKYEITFIIRPDMEEKEITKTAEELKKVLESEKAKVVSEKAIGQKELAYEIKKFNTGFYVTKMNFDDMNPILFSYTHAHIIYLLLNTFGMSL